MPQDIISQFDRKFALPIETNRQFATIPLRNAIPMANRWEGMIAYCKDTQLSYVLKGGLDNTFWVNMGDIVDVTVVDDLLSTSATDALSANQGRILKDLIDSLPTGDVDSVFGRTGAVTAEVGDYSSFYEPLFSKNTGFNKNFGTTAGTVSEGDHTHTFASLTAKPTTISGYGITDFNSLGDARWLKRTTDTLTGNLTVTGGIYEQSALVYDQSANKEFVIGGTDNGYVNNGTASHWRTYISGNRFSQTYKIQPFLRSTGYVDRFTFDQTGAFSAADTIFGNRLQTTVQGDAEDLLIFNTERPWRFRQGGTGAGTSLDLVELSASKLFRLGDGTNFNFSVHSGVGSVTAGGIVTTSAIDAIAAYCTGPNSAGYFVSSGTGRAIVANQTGSSSEIVQFRHNGSAKHYFYTSGGLYATGYLESAGQTYSRGFQGIGNSSGVANTIILGFFESNNSTRQGYVGFPSSSNSHLYLRNDISNKQLTLKSDGVMEYNGATNIIGSLTAQSYKTSNWEIIETSGVLQFKYGGVTKFEFNSSGTAEAVTDWKLGL